MSPIPSSLDPTVTKFEGIAVRPLKLNTFVAVHKQLFLLIVPNILPDHTAPNARRLQKPTVFMYKALRKSVITMPFREDVNFKTLIFYGVKVPRLYLTN